MNIKSNSASVSHQSETLRYLMNQLVVIITHYPIFNLTKIRYADEDEEFIVDTALLKREPVNKNTLSLKLLGGR